MHFADSFLLLTSYNVRTPVFTNHEQHPSHEQYYLDIFSEMESWEQRGAEGQAMPLLDFLVQQGHKGAGESTQTPALDPSISHILNESLSRSQHVTKVRD